MSRPEVVALLVVAGLGLPSGCGSRDSARTSVKAGPPVGSMELKAELEHRSIVEHPDALGISGSCRDQSGVWLIAERNARLLRLDPDGSIESIPIEGVPQNLDLEGLACKSGRFYASTESDELDRTGDVVLVIDFFEEVARVTEVLTMHYPAGLTAGVNQGLEGLCVAGDWLIGAGEILMSDSSGDRKAPILRQKLGDDNTFLHWVVLTSTTGKISGIDCRMRGETIEVFAIERHYEVARLLQFDLGEGLSKSETVVDMAHLIREAENFESILVDEAGKVRLTNDNQYKTITGPTEETFLSPISAFAR